MSLHDDEPDPTGMRELLRGLPDPGPMPDDLVARIQSSLADEATPEATTPGREAPAAVSRGTSARPEPARPSWWARTGPRAAVAAAVLLGGGAVASGQLGLLTSSDDSASTSADSSVGGRAESDAGSDSGGAAGPEFTDGDASGRQTEAGPVTVTMSDRRYTSAGLGGELTGASSTSQMTPLAAEAPGIGPIGTEVGVRSCLVALGLPSETGAGVDLGLLDGRPAAVVVVTGPGGRTAYAVGRDCTVGNPSLLAGPIDLP